MRAAFHAVAALLAVAALGAPAAAQGAPPSCPPLVGDLPLSVSTPFSGTPRPEAGGDGEIASTSLLCAYGEGVEPSAEVLLTWSADATCGTSEARVAPSLDRSPFDAVAGDLAAAVGGTCPPAEGATFPVVPVAAGGAAVALLVGAATIRRRRRATPPDAASGTRSLPQEAGIGCQNEEVEAVPDLSPVLAELSTVHGRALARSEAGQWLAVAAVAHAVDRPDAARLAHVGGHPGRRRARPEPAVLAEDLAHQATGGDR